jgi:excisionase family DNA binding protein
MTESKQDRVLSVKDVAQMCRVSNETIRRWIRKHGLNAYNTSGGLAIKILESDLRSFAEDLNVFVDWKYLDNS